MRSITAHDFARRPAAQTVRDRKELQRMVKPKPASYPLDESKHMRRLLRTEFNGGMVLGFIFGVAFAVVSLALSFPAWAPLVIWMARS